MLKIYCSDCGAPTEYSLNKPKFCSGCARPFVNSLANKSQNQVTQVKPILKNKNHENDYEDDDHQDQEINHVPQLSKLDCEIIESKPRGVKIKDLAGTSNAPKTPSDANFTIKSKKMSKAEKKKAAISILKEGASIRVKK